VYPVQSNEIYQYYPKNWRRPGEIIPDLGDQYGLIFLQERNTKRSGRIGEVSAADDFQRSKLVGIIIGEFDPEAYPIGIGNFERGTIAFRCRFPDKATQGISVTEEQAQAVAQYGCAALGGGALRSEMKFAEWKLSSLSNRVEIERKITKKKKKK